MLSEEHDAFACTVGDIHKVKGKLKSFIFTVDADGSKCKRMHGAIRRDLGKFMIEWVKFCC